MGQFLVITLSEHRKLQVQSNHSNWKYCVQLVYN